MEPIIEIKTRIDSVEALQGPVVAMGDGQPIDHVIRLADDLLRRLHIAPDRLVAGAYLDLLKADAPS